MLAAGAGAAAFAPTKVGRPESPAKRPATVERPSKAARKPARRTRRRLVRLVTGGAIVVVAGVAAVLAVDSLTGGGPAHSISTPNRLLNYVQEPSLTKGMGAAALRAEIVKKANGEARHVVDGVYEDSTSPAAKSGPQIILFVGGNLSGSASSFISTFTGLLPSAFVINPGGLGGQAACVPGSAGHPAACAWADNDTFGLIASPALTATVLGKELRAIRPLVEHVVK